MGRKRRQLPSWSDQPMYLAIRAALAGIAMSDVNDAVRMARSLGRTIAKFEPKRVRRAMDAIGVAFPEMDDEGRHHYAIRAYEHLITLGVEMAFTPRLITPDAWSERVRMGTLDRAVRLLVQDRPCVMITGHCGNWELLGYAMALIGFPMHALYRPLDLKPLDSWLRATRERRGLVLLDKFGAAKRMPGLMAKNARIAFIADQNAGDRGLFVPFFGRLASTYKAIGLLAIQHNAPVICGVARRLVHDRDAVTPIGAPDPLAWNGDAFHYRLDVIDVIMPEEFTIQADPLFYISARYRRALEEMVRRAPEQNLWLHRYWKSRPRHELADKPFPPSLRAKLRSLPWMTDDELAKIEDWSARDAAEIADKAPKPTLAPLSTGLAGAQV